MDEMELKKDSNDASTPDSSRLESGNEFQAGRQEPDTSLIGEPDETNGSDSYAHIHHVRNCALQLFEKTRVLHELDDDSKELLVIAADYINSSLPKGKKKSIAAIKKMIQTNLDTNSMENLGILIALVALNNLDLKPKQIGAFDLEPMEQREVLTLAALLSVAEGLDETGDQTTTISQVELVKGEMWVVVNGPSIAVDIASAQHNASLWEKIGYPKIRFLEADQAKSELLPYPGLLESPGVLVEDTLAEAGRKVMRYHFARMLSYEGGTRLGENIEELHKMRVATRRMRAAFLVFGDSYQPQSIKYYLKGLRATGRVLGQVRDLDVFIEKANKYQEAQPEGHSDDLAPLINYWIQKRDSAREKLVSYLGSEQYHSFKRKFNVFLHTSGSGAKPIQKSAPSPSRVYELAPVMVYSCLASVRSYDPFLVDAKIETLHALRIEIKKLRYSIEFFQEVMGADSSSVISDLKMMQDHLGNLNDAQVAAQSIQKFIEGWDTNQENLPISKRQNPEPIVTYLASRHAELHRLTIEFGKAWEYFNRPEFKRNLALSIANL